MRHDFIFELLKPFMQLHVILISTSVVVLPAPRFAPVCLRQLQRAIHFAIENAVPLRSLSVQAHRQDTRLDSKLEYSAALIIRGTKHALLSLVAAGGAAGYVPKLRPGQVVGEHA